MSETSLPVAEWSTFPQISNKLGQWISQDTHSGIFPVIFECLPTTECVPSLWESHMYPKNGNIVGNPKQAPTTGDNLESQYGPNNKWFTQSILF